MPCWRAEQYSLYFMADECLFRASFALSRWWSRVGVAARFAIPAVIIYWLLVLTGSLGLIGVMWITVGNCSSEWADFDWHTCDSYVGTVHVRWSFLPNVMWNTPWLTAQSKEQTVISEKTFKYLWSWPTLDIFLCLTQNPLPRTRVRLSFSNQSQGTTLQWQTTNCYIETTTSLVCCCYYYYYYYYYYY